MIAHYQMFKVSRHCFCYGSLLKMAHCCNSKRAFQSPSPIWGKVQQTMEPALLCSCAAQLTDAAAAVNLNLDRRFVNLCIMIIRKRRVGCKTEITGYPELDMGAACSCFLVLTHFTSEQYFYSSLVSGPSCESILMSVKQIKSRSCTTRAEISAWSALI